MSDDSRIFRPESGDVSVSYSPRKPRQEQVYHFMVATAAIVVVIAGIKAASGLIAPILLALFIAIILLVPLRWLQKKGCPNALALVIVLGGTIVAFSGISYLIGKSVNDFLLRLPAYTNRITRKFEGFEKEIESGLSEARSEATVSRVLTVGAEAPLQSHRDGVAEVGNQSNLCKRENH